MDNQSLRGFLEMVETRYPDELLRVRAEVDMSWSPTWPARRAARGPDQRPGPQSSPSLT
jgi:hypothetical protein